MQYHPFCDFSWTVLWNTYGSQGVTCEILGSISSYEVYVCLGICLFCFPLLSIIFNPFPEKICCTTMIIIANYTITCDDVSDTPVSQINKPDSKLSRQLLLHSWNWMERVMCWPDRPASGSKESFLGSWMHISLHKKTTLQTWDKS